MPSHQDQSDETDADIFKWDFEADSADSFMRGGQFLVCGGTFEAGLGKEIKI